MTQETPIISFLIDRFFGLKILEDYEPRCWRCRPSSPVKLIRRTEQSNWNNDIVIYDVFQCTKVREHIFRRRAKT
jgi:hypothetical protein